MKKTFGVFAHVDSGKTTFSEQILYYTKSIKSRGRVDHKDAYLDSHKIEKERGITVFSDVGVFNYKEDEYFLIDTPGHIDFSPEMERVIPILDFGVIIISGVEGVQGHTETIWNLLRKNNIPTLIFINKMDREGADLNRVLKEIYGNLTKNVIFYEKELSEEDIEKVAEGNEDLLEEYFEKGYSKEKWDKEIISQVKRGELFPLIKGSALNNKGILESLECFHKVFKTEYSSDGEFKGRVFKIKYDEKGNRVTFIKGISGRVKSRDEITYMVSSEEYKEKVNFIRKYNGEKFLSIDEGKAGEVFGVIGISSLKAGDGIGLKGRASYEIIPTLKSKVIFNEKENPREVYSFFKLLESEEESLNVHYDEDIKELHISVMGKIQLEVLKEEILERFNLKVDFGECEILYKETIKGEVEGFGHFEPLKHYAEVHFRIEEGKRGSGISYENLCHSDYLTTGNQNLIKSHVFEKEHRGILTGSPITDLKITLLTGRSHNKHTSSGDFREATKRALRQGLEKSNSVLLEPYYDFKFEVENSLIGRVLSDIQKMSGEFLEPITNLDKVIIEGKAPVATLMNYPLEFFAYTKGKGKLSFKFSGYYPCHNEEEVIKRIGYDKKGDREYSSSSIFCSKGEGFIVPFDECEAYMHCLK